jgi:predicted RNA polymerase sigma factor
VDATEIPDERLELLFTCCHPALALEAQVGLTLRTLGGLTTEEIARAFLVPETTMRKRVARAKGKIAAAGIPFRVPPAHLLPDRLAAVLAVVYLIFNEGYGGRGDLAAEAIRLGRALAELLPDEAEVHGLLALMLLHDARRDARFADGSVVLLRDQDRSRWNGARIEEGRMALERARALGGRGPYALQAEIAALHLEDPQDWPRLAGLYGRLAALTGSPVVELNRAAAVAEAGDVVGALAAVERLGGLDGYAYPPLDAGRAATPARPDGRGAGRVRAGARADAGRARAALPRGAARRATLGHGREVDAVAPPLDVRELADARATLGTGDGAERDRLAEPPGFGRRNDRHAVDPLAVLARVDVDERLNGGAGGGELAHEALPDRAGAPDDRRPAVPEERPAQVMDLAADEGVLTVAGVGARLAPCPVAPAQDDGLHVPEAGTAGPEAQDEIVVLRPARLAVAAGALDRFPADDERGVRERALDEDVSRRRLRGDERVQPCLVAAQPVGHPVFGDELDRAADRVEPLTLERVDLQAKAVWQRDVVRVHPGEDAAARPRPRPLERGDDPLTTLAQEPEARVPPRVRRRDLARIVCGAVVHDERLELRERLRRERRERVREERLAVPDGQKHRDRRTAALAHG